jgi:hypothetical protein
MTRFWLAFLAVQFAGLLCAAGIEIFHQRLLQLACHVIALILLEPGLILARAIIDKFYWERFNDRELFRYAAVSGFFLNAAFAIWLRAIYTALRPQHKN